MKQFIIFGLLVMFLSITSYSANERMKVNYIFEKNGDNYGAVMTDINTLISATPNTIAKTFIMYDSAIKLNKVGQNDAAISYLNTIIHNYNPMNTPYYDKAVVALQNMF